MGSRLAAYHDEVCGKAWLLGGVLLLLLGLQAARSWHFAFIDLDDPLTIVDHELVNGLGRRPFLDYVRPERFGALPEYMPLKTLSLAIDRALLGPAPEAYRGQQLLWYALCVFGVWWWSRAFLRAAAPGVAAEPIAAAATLLFALHPAHAESVTWLSGRKDLMCGAFMLGALSLALRRGASLGALACSVCALLSKPIGVALLPCLLVQDFVCRPGQELRRRAPFYCALAAAIGVFMLAYLQVSGDGGQSIRPEARDRIYVGPAWFRMLQQLGLFLRYACLPFGLSPEMPATVLGPLDSPRAWALAFAGVLLLLAAGWGLLRRQPWAALLALFVLPLAPIVVRPPWSQYVAGRYLFLSIAPLALLIAWGVAELVRSQPRVRVPIYAAMAAAMLTWGLERFAYDGSFRDSPTLWAQASAQFPDAPGLVFHAAQAAANAGQVEAADGYYERCLALAPQHPLCAAQFGTSLLGRDPTRAERLLRAALVHDETGLAHRSLAFLWAARGRASEGADLYRSWLATHQVDAERVRPMIGLALASRDRELTHKALRKVLQVMALETPTKPPPLELFERTAEKLEEPELAAAARAAAKACQRTDCFAQRLYGGAR